MTVAAGVGRCPICTKAAVAKYRPFCSRRCADLDLHQWLGGHYRVQTEETQDSVNGDDGEPEEF
ncbi:MAG: DNA gyrase inhibitor YacG [Alphaproteobacteria bacterium]